MINILIVIALISLNHLVDTLTFGELGYDTRVIDIAIGIAYILYIFL